MPEPKAQALSLRNAVANGEVQANAPKQDFSQASCPSFRPKFGHASVWSFKSECGVNWFGRKAA
jgi:hypothetical protein